MLKLNKIMEQSEINKRNSAMLTLIGGPLAMMKILHGGKDHMSEDYIKAMANSLTVDNLKFHESWDWMIPLWSKVRFKLSPSQIIPAITCIDENCLQDLFILLSNIIKNNENN